MTHQRLAGGAGAEAVHQVEDPGRHADLLHHLGEQGCAGRSLLGGFDDHHVAAGERGRHLPGEQQERQVPGDDHRHHAHGLVQRIVERAAPVGRGHLVALRRARQRQVRVGAEVGRAARNIERARLPEGLAGIGDLGGDERAEAPLDARRPPCAAAHSARRWSCAPTGRAAPRAPPARHDRRARRRPPRRCTAPARRPGLCCRSWRRPGRTARPPGTAAAPLAEDRSRTGSAAA